MEETFERLEKGFGETEERLRFLNDTLLECLAELFPTSGEKEALGVIQDSVVDCLNASFANWKNKENDKDEFEMIKDCLTSCLNLYVASLRSKTEEVLGDGTNSSISGNLSLSLDPTGNEVLLRSPLRVASYMSVQVILMMGVWTSAGVVVATILHGSSTRDQYLYWYLLSLALATIISGFYHPMTMGWAFLNYLTTGRYSITHPDVCFAANVLLSCYRSVLCSSIFLMAMERYITILKPLTHCYILTEKRIRISILGTWFLALSFVAGLLGHRAAFVPPLAITFCSLEIYEVRRVNAAQMCFGIILYICVIAMYLHLQVIAQRHLRVIEDEHRSFGLAQFKLNMRRTNIAVRITIFVLMIEVPIYVMNALLWCEPQEMGEKYMKAIIMFLIVSQLLQPIFYALLSPDFRNSAYSLFGKTKKKVAPNKCKEFTSAGCYYNTETHQVEDGCAETSFTKTDHLW